MALRKAGNLDSIAGNAYVMNEKGGMLVVVVLLL